MEQIMGRSISVTSYRWARCARLRRGDGGTVEGGKASGATWHSSLIAVVSVWDLEVIYCGIYWMESNQNEGSSLIVNA